MSNQTNLLADLLKDLPETLSTLQKEAGTIGKTILDSQLQKANVVSREEFEEQKLILQAVLEKLNTIEVLLAEK